MGVVGYVWSICKRPLLLRATAFVLLKSFGLDYFGILPWPGTAEILPFSGM